MVGGVDKSWPNELQKMGFWWEITRPKPKAVCKHCTSLVNSYEFCFYNSEPPLPVCWRWTNKLMDGEWWKSFRFFFTCFVILIYKFILSRLFSLSLYLALPIIGFLFISTLCSGTDSLQPVLDLWLKLHLMLTLEDIPDTVTKAKVHLVEWWL